MKIILFAAFSMLFTFGAAQYTYIPDENFEQALIDLGYDDVLDQQVLTENISSVHSLELHYRGIADLTGINDFTNLAFLHIPYNDLTTIDISGLNNLTLIDAFYNNLTHVDISNLENLSIVDFGYNKLNSFTYGNNPVLQHLGLNGNRFTELTIKDLPVLNSITVENNLLETLIFENLPLIDDIKASFNNLTEINVLDCHSLVSLEIKNNQLEYLDLSGLSNLMYANVEYNEIESVTFEDNHFLFALSLQFNKLAEIDLSNLSALTMLLLSSNQLTSLDLRNNSLYTLSVSNNLLQELYGYSWGGADTTNNPELYCIELPFDYSYDFQPEDGFYLDPWTNFSHNCGYGTFTYIPDDNFEQYFIDLGRDDILDDYVSTPKIAGRPTLNIQDRNIADLTGFEAMVRVRNIYARNNLITSIDLSQHPIPLYDLDFRDNNLTSLNIQNGFNQYLSTGSSFRTTENPELFCIQVDDPAWSEDKWPHIDSWTSFSENCEGLNVSDIKLNSAYFYPNPVQDYLYFNEKVGDIKIYTTSGKLVFAKTELTDAIRLNLLSKGTYMIQYTLKDGEQIRSKLIKK